MNGESAMRQHQHSRPRPGPQRPAVSVHGRGERERVRRLTQGDAAAFRDLVREYHAIAFDLAFGALGNERDAEEVVQDAFVKIHQALHGFRGEASLKTWILRIVMRLSLNRRRDRSRSAWRRLGLHRASPAESSTPEPRPAYRSGDDPESNYISDETRRRVLELIDQLPEPLRHALILSSFEDLSYEEIARILAVPLGTVSSRIHSARRRLMGAMQDSGLL